MATVGSRLTTLETVYARRASKPERAPYPTWLTDLIETARRDGRAPAEFVGEHLGMRAAELRAMLERRAR